ncbi:hypothetical protein BDF20DRAFT_863604 [Mycotypha africana]|uniref:uncharacterized protein n=1 Tax=Mycotypha africana TaxID=64632 RepID=UPI0023019845|nr:uncharacterized protein BDF20DRAFT_863604 [Mycotypha africana]KAI8981854.1 hypothetical protein BDF20DRAFT_863604 [Mycotypha africana]
MDRLPLEVILHIFSYLPLSSYRALYAAFPGTTIIDEALTQKLRLHKQKPIVNIVSTNSNELATNLPANNSGRNESFLPLYYHSFDSLNRFIWILPDFTCSNHYCFKVKDVYVSHGKLLLKNPNNDDNSNKQQQQQQKYLISLWDIRKNLPPTRAGSFSGASEFSRTNKYQEMMTIYQSGCILDSCLIPATSGMMAGQKHQQIYNIRKSVIIHRQSQEQTVIEQQTEWTHKIKDGHLYDSRSTTSNDEGDLKRPQLPADYARQIPTTTSNVNSNASSLASFLIPTFPDIVCGYYFIDRVALSIPTLLDLYS